MFSRHKTHISKLFEKWPFATRLAALSLLALYIPVIWEVGQLWLKNDTYSHGLLVLPVCFYLLWMLRDEACSAPYAPERRGLYWLGLGLLLETVAWLLRIKFIAIASIVPTLAGSILALHGRALWKVLRFPVGFLIFMAPLPGALLNYPSAWIQHASSAGAASIMDFLGYTISREGNVITIPGMALEVAQACSGFKKLFALFAFAVLYGYLFDLPTAKRLLLVVAVVPIALMANIARVSGMIAVSTAGGPHALHLAHDGAELFVVIVSCVLFVALGKRLGCEQTRFSTEGEKGRRGEGEEKASSVVQSLPLSTPPDASGNSDNIARVSPSPFLPFSPTALWACALLLVALGANLLIRRMPIVQPHLVPIETFPSRIGEWKQSGRDIPVDPQVQQVIPTAHLVQRIYEDSRHRQVELVLITASDYYDFHDPTVCFPGHGFALADRKVVNIGGQLANYMTAYRNTDKMNVLYWVPGDFMASVGLGPPMKKMVSLRRFLTGEQGGSMVVRVAAYNDVQGIQTAEQFAKQIIPIVNALNKVPHA